MKPPENRLVLYKNAIRKMKNGDFFISFPDTTIDSHLRDFENDLIELSAWIDQRFREISKLHEISTEISNGSLLSGVLERIYHAFQEVIPYDRIGCALISDDGKEVITHWAKTNYQERIRLARGFSAPLIGSSLEPILQTKQPRFLNDLEEYLGDHPESNSTRLMVAEGVQSSLTCPLVANEETIGFIFFSSLEKNTYRDIHQKIFVYIAQQVSLLIERSRLYQQVHELNHRLADAMALLREQACRDALTGVYHRGTIMEFLGKNLHAGVRKKQPVSVIMVDVDNFKAINDIYDYIVSDAVLQQVAKTMV
ncbi:MAG: diguanylate cyclase, partial [Gammaproteobacteria bacterium]|nr:diguanylate cyclase [Gammaproteobacteria bacterium]